MTVLVANNAVSRLAGGLSSAATALGVMPGDGAKFPAISDGNWFPLTLVKSDGTLEIVKCTARAADALTIARAQEGTQALEFSAGDRVELRITKAVVGELQQKTTDAKSAADAAHDAAGAAQSTANGAVSSAEAASTAISELAQDVGQSIAMADAYTAVPTTFKAWQIVVTLPHLRFMVWSTAQNKYVRAPWHQPCQLFFSYDNPTSIPGALPVRGDAVWQQADFPDVVARLGLSGTGTFTLAEARGEFIRALDNGRGVDAGRVLRSLQLDAIQQIYGELRNYAPRSDFQTTGAFTYATGGLNNRQLGAGTGVMEGNVTVFDSALSTRAAAETRGRNLAFPLWMTI